MNALEITGSKFYGVNNTFIKANGEIEFNNKLVIKIAIGDGKNGLMVVYKSDVVEKDGQKNYYPHIKFSSDEARDEINSAIIDHYKTHLTKNSNAQTQSGAQQATPETIHNQVADNSPSVDEDDIPF